MPATKEELEAAERRRGETSDAIAESEAGKKLIVAGPGTGKTHNFKRVLADAEGEGLALTFIRALADDLEKDLGEVARVNTLHGYCKGLAHRLGGVGLSSRFDYYPSLFSLLTGDLALLRGAPVSAGMLDACLHNLEDTDGLLTEALELGAFYDAVSHTDAVYRVLRQLEADPEAVPKHPVVVVDEYQDFSLLETRFVDALATKSPVLIAGDDDQALYGFKHASANFIRNLAEDPDYERFHLPYCSRCTEVIVQAVNNVVDEAQRRNYLANRLDREYLCYLPDKLIDSNAHPAIVHAACTVESKKAPYIGRYVAEQVAAIPEEDVIESHERKYPTALVIGRRHFVTAVYDILKEQFPDTVLRISEPAPIEPLDGYRRLADDASSSLGWRILLEGSRFPGQNKVLQTALANRTALQEVLPADYQEHHLALAVIVGKLLEGTEIASDEEAALGEGLGAGLDEIRARLGLGSGEDEAPGDEASVPIGPSVVCTSLLGAKGLQAGYVFIVGFNDEVLPAKPGAITDDEICKLIVGLSRTRKECHIVSCGRYAGNPMLPSSFLDWLGVPIETRTINKRYWESKT